MDFKKIDKFIKSENGSSIMLVLCVIMVLSMLGTAALVMSAYNVKLGVNYKNWSQDYYKADKNAEQALAQIDNMLQRAENAAYQFFYQELFRDEYNSDVKITSNDDNDELTQTQWNLFHDRWQDKVYNDSLVTLNDATEQTEGEEGEDSIAFEYLDDDLYQDKMEDYFNEGFPRLYFCIAQNILITELCNSSSDFSEEYHKYIYNNNEKVLEILNTKSYQSTITGEDKWDDLSPSDYPNGTDKYDMAIKLVVQDDTTTITPTPTASSTHEITITLGIKTPEITAADEIINHSFRGNPIWANAITAQGSVEISGDEVTNVNVYGDITAATKDNLAQPYSDINDEENNRGIILSSDDAVFNLFGNAYTYGDFHVDAINSTINVNKYTTSNGYFTIDNKLKMFGATQNDSPSGFMFENPFLSVNDRENYSDPDDDEGGSDNYHPVPVLFKESEGGNVFCNSLIVNGSSNLSNINVQSNVWTKDDIQMDGSNSNIAVNGMYIGISQNIENGDPNACSSVLNNYSNTSTISLRGDMIVPGVGFYKFDSYNNQTVNAPYYYMTTESVSARNLETFTTYMSYGSNEYDEYGIDENNIKLYKYNKNNLNEFQDFFSENIDLNSVDTKIFVDNDVSGYALASVIAKKGDSYVNYAGESSILKFLDTKLAYEEMDVKMDIIHSIKTECFGTSIGSSVDLNEDYEGDKYLQTLDTYRSVRNFVNYDKRGALGSNFIDGDGTLTISGNNNKGIIYCTGNLTIKKGTDVAGQDNVFRGSIICEGNVTIEGDVSIIYDEKVISQLIIKNPDIKEFFEKGADYVQAETFNYNGISYQKNSHDCHYQEFTSTTGSISNVERFKIEEWIEKYIGS